MSEVLAKGYNDIFTFFRKIKDDIVKWFKENLKEFEANKLGNVAKYTSRLSNEAEIILKKYADNAIIGYSKLVRPTVVSILEGKGKQVLAYSNKPSYAKSSYEKLRKCPQLRKEFL